MPKPPTTDPSVLPRPTPEMKIKAIAPWFENRCIPRGISVNVDVRCDRKVAASASTPAAHITPLLRSEAMLDPTVTGAPARAKSQIALELALGYLKDGTLSIDDEGRFWRHHVHDRNGRRKPIPPRRAESPTRKGYLALTFGVPKTRRTAKVLAHVAAWTWLNGPIPKGMQVNHKDLNKANNRRDNHELLTGAGNIQHSYANGRKRPWSSANVWRPGKPRITAEREAEVVRLRGQGFSARRISPIVGISPTQVDRIFKKKRGAP